MPKIDCLSKSYDGREVLSCFSCILPEKGRVLISGASGRGKTTLLRIIAGLEKPDKGILSGFDNKKLSFLFQEDRLFPWLTAGENVEIACDNKNKAKEELEALELSDAFELYPDELSGGMKRRVSLARALARGGEIFLFDEPDSGLDQKLALLVKERIDRLSENALCIVVSHSPQWKKEDDENMVIEL